MLYRIRVDLAFTKQASVNAISKTAKDHLSKATTINPGLIDEERGFIIAEQCYHDEDPTHECEVLEAQYTE